jgi:hypothetical protein
MRDANFMGSTVAIKIQILLDFTEPKKETVLS